jgi:hypothetical protein
MLHGLGDSGDGWAPVGAEWAPDLKHVKFVFPHAPNVRRRHRQCCQPCLAASRGAVDSTQQSQGQQQHLDVKSTHRQTQTRTPRQLLTAAWPAP